MALTLPQALQRLAHPVAQGFIKTVVTTDQMAAIMPIEPIAGDAYRFVREGDLADSAFIGDDGVTTEESTGTDDRTMIEFRRISGNMDVDGLADVLSGGVHRAAKMAAKVKATWRKVQRAIVDGNRVTSHTLGSTADPFAAIAASASYSPWLDSDRRGPGSLKYTHTGQLWQFRAPGDPAYGVAVAATTNGTYTLYSYNKSKWIQVTITVASATTNGETHIRFNTTTNEFEGLKQICHPAQLIDPVAVNGDDYALSLLDRLISTEKVRTNRAFVMNSALMEKHYAAIRALGGATPEFTEISIGVGMARVPAYRGVPLLENDFIQSDETVGATTDASSIYLGSFDFNEGIFLAGTSFGGQQLPAEADPRSVPVLGFYVKDVGELEGKDARRTRVVWQGALGLKSPLALARRRGVKTA